MKFYRYLFGMVVMGALLVSCAALPSQTTTTQAAPGSPGSTIQVPTPAPAVAQAENTLAQKLNINLNDVSVVSVEPVDWPDSCLGVPAEGEMCAQMVTPGFRITLSAGNQTYVYHTNMSGDEIRMEQPEKTTPQVPPAVQKSVQTLADKLNLEPRLITVVKSEAVEWRDACLGVSEPGMMCAQVITPGYLVVLEANGQQYEYHTNQSGSQVILAGKTGTPASPQSSVIEWTDQENGCQALSVSLKQAKLSDCQGKVTATPNLQPTRQAELNILASAWQPFTLTIEQGTLTYNGTGSSVATPAEQRSVYEWMDVLRDEVAAGRSNGAAGLAIAWHREGGIAGFCDDLSIYLTGFAYSTTCKSGQSINQGRVRLSADQLQQVYDWINNFQAVDFTQEDNATADAMRQHLVLNGTGMKSPTLDDKQAMLSLVSQIQAKAASQPTSADLGAATAALKNYFDALKSGDYDQVLVLYGGTYDTLQNWNPDVDPKNQQELWKRGCTQNGLRCDLILGSIKEAEAISPDTFRFAVTFTTQNGDLFQLGPCCGEDATQQPPITEFDFTVKKMDNQFKVEELPVYVP